MLKFLVLLFAVFFNDFVIGSYNSNTPYGNNDDLKVSWDIVCEYFDYGVPLVTDSFQSYDMNFKDEKSLDMRVCQLSNFMSREAAYTMHKWINDINDNSLAVSIDFLSSNNKFNICDTFSSFDNKEKFESLLIELKNNFKNESKSLAGLVGFSLDMIKEYAEKMLHTGQEEISYSDNMALVNFAENFFKIIKNKNADSTVVDNYINQLRKYHDCSEMFEHSMKLILLLIEATKRYKTVEFDEFANRYDLLLKKLYPESLFSKSEGLFLECMNQHAKDVIEENSLKVTVTFENNDPRTESEGLFLECMNQHAKDVIEENSLKVTVTFENNDPRTENEKVDDQLNVALKYRDKCSINWEYLSNSNI